MFVTYHKDVKTYAIDQYKISLGIFNEDIIEEAKQYGHNEDTKVFVHTNSFYTFICFKNGDRIDAPNN